MRTTSKHLELAKKFSSTSNYRQVAIGLFIAMMQDIDDATNNDTLYKSSVAQCAAKFFSEAEGLSLTKFKELFHSAGQLIPWLKSGLFDRGRLYFGDFYHGLSKELRECLSVETVIEIISSGTEAWRKSIPVSSAIETVRKFVASETNVPAAAAMAVQHQSNAAFSGVSNALAATLDGIVAKHEDERITVGECKKLVLAFSSSPDQFNRIFTPEAVREWLAKDLKKQVVKTIILLELRLVLMYDEKAKRDDMFVPMEGNISDDLLVSTGILILNELEKRCRKSDEIEALLSLHDNENTNEILAAYINAIKLQSSIFSKLLPSHLYQRIFLSDHVQSWKTYTSYDVARILAMIFVRLDNVANKTALVDALAPASECNSHGVLKDYWCCTENEAQAKFPEVTSEVFLANLHARQPHENLRAALRIFSRLNTHDIEELIKDLRFDWSCVIESPIVLNLIVTTLWFRNDFLGAPPATHYVLWNSYLAYQSSFSEKYLQNLAASSLSAQRDHSSQSESNSVVATRGNDRSNSQAGFNPGYWYDSDDVNSILKREIENRLLMRAQGQPVIAALAPHTFEDLERLKLHLTDGLKDIRSNLSQNAGTYTVLIPLHMHGDHWVGCKLDIDRTTNKAIFSYIDPILRPQVETINMVRALRALFSEILGNGYKVEPSSELTKHPIWYQPDLCSCGPYVIANFMRYAYSEGLQDATPTAAAIRQAHVRMMGAGFSAKQFVKPDTTPLFQVTAQQQEKEKQEKQNKTQKLHGSVSQLHSDTREVFYRFCRTSKINEDSCYYTNLRATIHDVFNIEVASTGDSKIGENLLAVIKEIFPGVTSDMDSAAIWNHVDQGSFSEDLPDVLAMVYQIEQQKSASQDLSTAIAAAAAPQSTEDAAFEIDMSSVNSLTVDDAVQWWKKMAAIAQKIDESDAADVNARVNRIALFTELQDAMTVFCSLRTELYKDVFAHKELRNSIFDDKNYSSIRVLAQLCYSSTFAIPEIKMEITRILAEGSVCPNVIKDYWMGSDEQSFENFPPADVDTFLEQLPNCEPEKNLRCMLRICAYFRTVKEVEVLITDSQFNWSRIIQSDEVLKLILAAMFFKEEAEDDSLAVANGVTNTLWTSYIQYKYQHGSSKAAFFVPASSRWDIEQSRDNGARLQSKISELNPVTQNNFYRFCAEFGTTQDSASRYQNLRKMTQGLFDNEIALNVMTDAPVSDDAVRTKFLSVLKEIFSNITDTMDVDAICHVIDEGKFVDDLPNTLAVALQIQQKASGYAAAARCS